MSIFEQLDDVLSETVDVINDTPFIMYPMAETTPNRRRSTDQSRQQISGRCIFDYPSDEYGIELGVRKTYRESNDLRAVAVGRQIVISIDRKYFPALDDEPRQGDVIELTEQAGLPRLEIVSVRRDGLARLELIATLLGHQT